MVDAGVGLCRPAVDFAVGTNDGFTHSLFAEEAGGSSETPFGKASLFLPRHRVVAGLDGSRIGSIKLAKIVGESRSRHQESKN